ncbi:hypothetical protein [Crossiella cryophila]|uniref:Uncharacterized protein n=1 Tax=Crossiella cryophila TaxID=43355 RepID=A0A7W7FQ18_9PSEU|nr:hypothetical protein [Crossiella cryophila]MBB4674436.1 hypothetical protein [Crossiella cryophila]
MPPDGNPRQLSSLALGALLALGWLTASGAAIALVTLTGDNYEEYPVETSLRTTEQFPTTFRTTIRTTTTRRTTPTTVTTPGWFGTTPSETPTTAGGFGGFGGQR